MTEGRNQRRGRRSPANQPHKRQGLWQAVPAPGTPEPIRPAADPAALISSLGPPPLRGNSSTAEYYLAAVVKRAADLATGLAVMAELVAESDDPEE
ncbi:MAG: hypothetical protein QOI95_2168 [Acidimicrobiaceae bacterium]|jgi:hypothetical protein